VSAYRLARAVVTAKTPSCDRYIVTSFVLQILDGRASPSPW
jgi:hypothetical protein